MKNKDLVTSGDFNKLSFESELKVGSKSYTYYNIKKFDDLGYDMKSYPRSIRILLEGVLRHSGHDGISSLHVQRLLDFFKGQASEIPFVPSRIVLQDFTGVPAVVDLAAMRQAVAKEGLDPDLINPVVPVDLIIDHSVMVDDYGNKDSLTYNVKKEFERNGERYRFLKWAKNSFKNFRAIPPSTGIIHQVNLEYLASIVSQREENGRTLLIPDTLVGTDSHTTMINGVGVLGWGVGGIEAEAGMLGQPIFMVLPKVVGVELTGGLSEGVTSTDLALHMTNLLRGYNVVGKFVEYYGEGLNQLSLPDRATVANMAPEYGATMGYFPVDEETLSYMELTGRKQEQIQVIREYLRAQGLFGNDGSDIVYSERLKVDLSQVKAALAGPKRPQDKIYLEDLKDSFLALEGARKEADHLPVGAVVLAAITSCTNTANPNVMIGAGLIAKKAVELGLRVPDYVKTSLTPGSLVVTEYLKKANVLESLEQLGFFVAGYGCATCIGNSGPLKKEVTEDIEKHDLLVASVLSGNRNFEGRIHSHIKANYLASPMLVVAYALAGRVTIDFETEAIACDHHGREVFLKDLWPSNNEVTAAVAASLSSEMFEKKYRDVFGSNGLWNDIPAKTDKLYPWEDQSTYIREPWFFQDLSKKDVIEDILDAKVLLNLGDSITTDHISPAGSIGPHSPAAKYLQEMGCQVEDFNSYGSRRGNHEVMMRGTFANIRIRNKLVDKEGGYTTYQGETLPVFDAAMAYLKDHQKLIVLAGKEYGTGSSRDWAAKGTFLLGVKAVIARSYERIHRSNLVGMGVLPLEFINDESADSLGLSGTESYSITGFTPDIKPLDLVDVVAEALDGTRTSFKVRLRIDSQMEIEYYLSGGILHKFLIEAGE